MEKDFVPSSKKHFSAHFAVSETRERLKSRTGQRRHKMKRDIPVENRCSTSKNVMDSRNREQKTALAGLCCEVHKRD